MATKFVITPGGRVRAVDKLLKCPRSGEVFAVCDGQRYPLSDCHPLPWQPEVGLPIQFHGWVTGRLHQTAIKEIDGSYLTLECGDLGTVDSLGITPIS